MSSTFARAYARRRSQNRSEKPGHAIGDLTALDRRRLLVIERDNVQGADASFKRIYLVDLRDLDAQGSCASASSPTGSQFATRTASRRPPGRATSGSATRFAFPFQTIESVLPLGRGRLLVLNDNNYPFSAGRNPAAPTTTS